MAPAQPPSAPVQSNPWGQLQAFPPSQPATDPAGQPAAPGQAPTPNEQPTYPYGVPGAPYPYGQPAAPSQPLYGQPVPGYPYAPYGQPAAPSQPLYAPGMPGAVPPMWGPPSQALPGTPPAAPRKSRRGLWIALGIVAAVLVLAGSGGAFAFTQYFAPATALGTFCGHLKTQDYSAAYNELSANLKSQFTADQFNQGSQTLDKIEGTVTSCTTAAGSSYNYSFGSSTAAVTAVIKRTTAGDLQGVVHLKNEQGGWKVDGLDTSLLGINLGALATASSFCAALQTQNYATAYGLLGSALTLKLTQQDFAQGAQLHDQIDGNVSSCSLNSIASGADDNSASLSVSVTRSKLGARQGAVNLQVEGSAWKIDALDQSLLGSDLQPLVVGARFCADLASGNYADLYALLSDNFKGGATEAQIASSLALPSPLVWVGCTPDLSTYKATSSVATYTAALNAKDTSTNQTLTENVVLHFVNSGGTWLVDDITKP